MSWTPEEWAARQEYNRLAELAELADSDLAAALKKMSPTVEWGRLTPAHFWGVVEQERGQRAEALRKSREYLSRLRTRRMCLSPRDDKAKSFWELADTFRREERIKTVANSRYGSGDEGRHEDRSHGGGYTFPPSVLDMSAFRRRGIPAEAFEAGFEAIASWHLAKLQASIDALDSLLAEAKQA